MPLYIVPTPIGNLEDITLRALRVLREAALIAAEDTRVSRVLLEHYDIIKPMISYHEHNKLARVDEILDVLESGRDVALISDAGTPGLSDPGYELINACLRAKVQVISLPGPNAAITALVASGLPTDRFTFLGFLPRKKHALVAELMALSDAPETLIAYESPYRLVETLQAICEIMGESRPVCVAREITKLFEEYFRGTARQALDYFMEEPVRGEVTLLIGGQPRSGDVWSEAQVRAEMQRRLQAGESRNAAAKAVAAESGWNKRDIYALRF
ncbi:MAG: 16S rRNA (cytidine(1402)-2'-O)-methyltransferase [Anaerolineae bacterium]|nr:16S rRNA (cytidine(1402)-2'-O)-methyltransferase [Anaerolineae bacterium]